MQHSKSQGSFAHDDSGRLPTITRPRARSSLDTFVIPGRTRIPSSKPESFDLQVTQNLLEPNMFRFPRDSESSDSGLISHEVKADREITQNLINSGLLSPPRHPSGSAYRIAKASKPSTGNSNSLSPNGPKIQYGPPKLPPLHPLSPLEREMHNVRPEIRKRPPPKIGGREVIMIPPRRVRKHSSPRKRQVQHSRQKSGESSRPLYDGALGSSFESRVTSTTWSTVSHRIFTDSSGISQGKNAFENLVEYNQLATELGIPKLEKCPGGKKTRLLY